MMLFRKILYKSNIKVGRTMLPAGTWGKSPLDHCISFSSPSKAKGPTSTSSEPERTDPFSSLVVWDGEKKGQTIVDT